MPHVSSWNDPAESVRAKVAVSGRLLGKEVKGCRLRWLDLQQADLRLGEKVFADPGADVAPEVRARLEEISNEKKALPAGACAADDFWAEDGPVPSRDRASDRVTKVGCPATPSAGGVRR